MNARDQAEKAVLGAILTDPRRLPELADWLAPEDFYTPQHQAVYQAMLDLDTRGATPDLNAAGTGDTADAGERAQQLTSYMLTLVTQVTEAGTRLDPLYLHTLMQACPRPEHAPHYARMVVEADTHRTIIENATRLAQVAHTQQQEPGYPWLDDLFVHMTAFRQVLDNLAERWGINPDDFDNPTTDPAVGEAADGVTRPAAGQRSSAFADQFAAELDTPPTPDQRAAAIEREDTVLACILRNPGQVEKIRDFLESEDFTTPDRAAYYQAALNLHDRGEPIDPITLTWEARRHATPASPSDEQAEQDETAPLTYERLTNMWNNGLPAEVAPYHARQILENAIRTTTTQAARDLKDLAANPRLTPVDLLTTAAYRIDQTARHETRWRASRPVEHYPYDARHPDQQATGRSL